MLDNDEGIDAVKEAGEQAGRLRVDGVPFFVVNNEIMLSGARPPDVFLVGFNPAVDST